MNIIHAINSITILTLLSIAICLSIKNKKLSKKNQLNDVTNSLLNLNINKRKIDDKINQESIESIIDSRAGTNGTNNT